MVDGLPFLGLCCVCSYLLSIRLALSSVGCGRVRVDRAATQEDAPSEES